MKINNKDLKDLTPNMMGTFPIRTHIPDFSPYYDKEWNDFFDDNYSNHLIFQYNLNNQVFVADHVNIVLSGKYKTISNPITDINKRNQMRNPQYDLNTDNDCGDYYRANITFFTFNSKSCF